MISAIIQIFAILLIAFAFLKEMKRDRLNELRKREELHDLFREQQEFFLKNLLEPLKAISIDEVQYMERQKDLLTSSNATAEVLGDLISEISQINSRLTALETPIKIWGEAQTQNEIQKGEANRTLRRRIQEKDAVLLSTRQTLKTQENQISELQAAIKSLGDQLENTRNDARKALDLAMQEVAETKAWMDQRGVPYTPLEKHLSAVFKGAVPSLVYNRLKDEQAMQESLGEALTHLADASRRIVEQDTNPQPQAVSG